MSRSTLSHRLAAVLVMIAAAASPPAASLGPGPAPTPGPHRGLLPVDDGFLLDTGLIDLRPGSPSLPPGREWHTAVRLHHSNSFAKSPDMLRLLESRPARWSAKRVLPSTSGAGSRRFLVDGEVLAIELAFSKRLAPNLAVEVGTRFLDSGGGDTDGVIEGFHASFGFGQAGRIGVGRDDYVVFLETPDGRIEVTEPGTGLGDTTVGLTWKPLAPSSSWDFALRGRMKVPTGNQEALFSSGSVDATLEVTATRELGRGALHLSATAARLGSWARLGLPEQTITGATVGYERPFRGRNSVVAQVSVRQSPYQRLDIEGLDETAILGTIGVKRLLPRGLEAFLAVTENAVTYESSADIAFHAGISRAW